MLRPAAVILVLLLATPAAGQSVGEIRKGAEPAAEPAPAVRTAKAPRRAAGKPSAKRRAVMAAERKQRRAASARARATPAEVVRPPDSPFPPVQADQTTEPDPSPAQIVELGHRAFQARNEPPATILFRPRKAEPLKRQPKDWGMHVGLVVLAFAGGLAWILWRSTRNPQPGEKPVAKPGNVVYLSGRGANRRTA